MSRIVAQLITHRDRVPAQQLTRHACLAASIADALGDLFRWSRAEDVKLLQRRLIDALGGLEHQGTFWPAAFAQVQRMYGGVVDVRVARMSLAHAVRRALVGDGVVIGLANPMGGEGHAIRIERGAFVLRHRDEHVEHAFANDVVNDLLTVDVFDPDPGVENCQERRVGDLRPRYEAAGSFSMLISLRT